ncbi:ATP-binding protein [Streptomyces carpinensis]|nr:LuxR C-terminal-related transcriptional regulator [Streptomyces carpinensis]
MTEIIGRERELITLCGRLTDPSVRLVTLTGPGGVGKSRLAVAAVRAVAAEFSGVWAAGPAEDPRTAGEDLRSAGEVIAGAASGRPLLVLDDADLGVRSPADAVATLLTEVPGLVVLVTAREPLRLPGERLVPIGPLSVPGPMAGAGAAPGADSAPEPDPDELREFGAVALFERRARDADPSFALTAENGRAVAALCTLLDGLPLAVELAAGRLRLFPPQTLLARLRRNTTVLAGGSANAPERHRSLAALAASALAGLDGTAREALERLAVYERGFGMSMAEPAFEAVLETLLERGLVASVDEEHVEGTQFGGPEPRFAVPEPVRSYCRTEAESAGRADAALDAHARRYRDLVAAAGPRLGGTEQVRWLRILEAEGSNVRAALHRLRVRGDGEAVAAMTLGCRLPWLVQGRLREGLHRCDEVTEEHPGLPEAVHGRLADMAGVFALALGDPHEAVRRHRRAIALGKSSGDRRQGALASAHLGVALLAAGEPQGAHPVLVTALSTLESLGLTGAAAEAAAALAAVLRADGKRRKAQELLDRSLESFRRVRDARGLAGALRIAASMALEGEEPERADRALRESLRLYESIGERTELPGLLEEFALLLRRVTPGQQPRMVRLLAAADRLRAGLGAQVRDEWRSQAERARTELSARLGWTDFATAWAEGVRMSSRTAVAEALSAPAPARGADAAPVVADRPPLTPRQVQVALLVGEGLTNRQIAARLDLSEWTVVNHVRQVMRRLGCTSRVQVAGAVGRWA